uniref:Zgc:163022 n=1 Tax=Hucho hucho TaxID=62062 RepID=A0A4W5KRX3_9TELE
CSQVCAFPNHVQLIEFTTGGLQSSCKNISRIINRNRIHLISHTSDSPKSSIQGIWRAPTSGNLNSIQFSASFVKDYSTFWVGVRSSPVTYNVAAAAPTNSKSIPITSTTSFLSNFSTGCGSTKVCFSHPLNCDPVVSPDCYFMSALTSPGDTAVQLEMTGPSDGYIAIGFSDDQRMGNYDIYICGRGSGGLIQLQHAFSTGRKTPEILPLGNVSDVESSVNNSIISCSFTTMNPISTQRSGGSSSLYYLMIVHGPSDNVDISSPQVVTSEKEPPIIKAHGSLMLIAWMTTGSLGMIIARYLKGVAKGKHYFGKDVWFLAHVSLMSLTVAATIIAFILAFSEVGGWSGGAHPVLGCIVRILAFFQPIAAMFRCGPHHHWRFLVNWLHALNAAAIKGLAVAAIFTGLSHFNTSEDSWLLKVMGGFVGWEATLYILDSFLTTILSATAVLDFSFLPQTRMELLLLVLFFLGNIAFLVALLVGIGSS